MFSRNSVIIIAVVVFLAINIIAISIVDDRSISFAPARIVISLFSPFQKVFSGSIGFVEDIWRDYFALVSVSKENRRLKKQLLVAENKLIDATETELANTRLRSLLNFQKNTNLNMLASEVIAKDPSAMFKSVMIDKGEADGLRVGLPVVLPEGIVGQITEVTQKYAKVLLVTDSNSSVDALVQRTRARGVVKGSTFGDCRLVYVLRKHEVNKGDILISSGLDGVYPKGLRLGFVSDVFKKNSGIFQEVTVRPYVDFEKLEEVLVIINTPQQDVVTKQ